MKESAVFLADKVSLYLCLFSPFLWAAQSKRFHVLLNKHGMKWMVGFSGRDLTYKTCRMYVYI
jgi:hypothetical protein